MKKILILLLLPLQTYCQQWYPMGAGVTNSIPSYPVVYKIISYQNKITIGGYFKKSNLTTLNGLAQWNGINWQNMGIGVWHGLISTPDSAGSVEAQLVIYNNALYAGGAFDGGGGSYINDNSHYAYNIAKWNGVDWFPLTQPTDGFNDNVIGMAEYKDKLYISGFFDYCYDSTGAHPANALAIWNDTILRQAASLEGYLPFSYWDRVALAFTIYNNKLITGGAFCAINGSPWGSYNGIASWNDTLWEQMSTGFNSPVYALTVFNGELYAAGSFSYSRDSATALNHVAKWNGSSWQQVGEGLGDGTPLRDTVMALCVDSVNNKLYAGGNFTKTGLGVQALHLAEWTGTNWQEVSGGTNKNVWSLFAKNGNLYVGGEFTQVGGTIPANLIACWGSNPSAINEIATNEEINIYPNPTAALFTIHSEGSKIKQIKITNTLGQQIKTITNTETLDITDLPNGIYFAEIKTEKGTVRKKIIKQ